MPKRRRERLRPTVCAEPVTGLPEICAPPGCVLELDQLRPEELVFLYITGDGQKMFRRARLDGGLADADAEDWKVLPLASLTGAEWLMCDMETGELVFTCGRKVIRVKPEGGERSFDVEERVSGENFDIGSVQSRRGLVFCYNWDADSIYLLARMVEVRRMVLFDKDGGGSGISRRGWMQA